uniref:Metalloendopeptidase n=2 Tax=Salmo trutta TaxID=8032 RepID=A0A674B693_SALTR
MYIHACLVVSLAVSQALAETSPKVKDIEDELDIDKINKDLHLREGDIVETFQRNGVLGDNKRWQSPVPYVLDSSLDMNTKGIILRAFDQFRLKTCMDFQPRDSEMYYLTIEKRTGCYSYVGRTFPNGQVVSIGQNCGIIAIVEHELLHALGFWHEQSRYDRDEYVTIVNENILEGYQNDFNKYSENDTTTLGTPYDYYSVMHYSKDAFTNGNGSTIITKQPEFQEVIGQRLEMSSNDVLKLNRMYSCNASVAFKESCSFSNSGLCGMSRCSRSAEKGSENGWERVTQAAGGPYTDHSNLGTNGTGFFMHASTASGQEGDTAWLESREMTPSRKCNVQCLQFSYYHSGNESDQLNIWIREYRDERDPNGTLRLMGQITGSPASYWQLLHVSLNATKTFQVEFEVRKGAGPSTGGVSIDDINLSETECPHHTWQIRDFENVAKITDTWLFSPRHYSRDGYAYQLMVVLRSTYIGVYARLLSGKYDDQLQWPCPWRQITFLLMDQNPNIQLRMSKQNSISTDPEQIDYKNGEKYLFWDNPRKNGTFYKQEGNDSIYATKGWGYGYFMSFKDIKDNGFLKGGDIIFLTSMQDISSLQYAGNNSLPCPTPPPQDFTLLHSKREEGPCSARLITTTLPPPTTTEEDNSIFGFSPGFASSPVVILLTLLLLLTH